jgi:pimeloyl-ACP methyl ester carboxylesterase
VRSYPEQLPRLAGLLPQIFTPVQIIAGRHDPLVPVAHARFLHARLRGGAPYHPDAAGMAAVAELVLATLAGQAGGSAG